MTPQSLARVLAALSLSSLALTLTNCTGGTKGDRDNRGDFKVVGISTGRGSIYPYRIRQVDSFGNPTATVLNIESNDTLKANVNGNNGVLPVATFGTAAELPNGNAGNHFIQFTFSHKLDPDSIISNLLANQTNSGLTTAIAIVAYDPATEQSTTMSGRGFVNGYTYFNEAGVLRLVKAVEENGDDVRILDARALGFPQGFSGAADLVSKKSFTFVADSDNDLTSLETFPNNRLMRLVISNAVKDNAGGILEQEIYTATTVGADASPPQVLGFLSTPSISPGNNETGVDPTTTVLVRFNKPVQPGDVGQFFDPQQFTPPLGGLTLSVTAAAQTFSVIYHADPLSYGDLCNYTIRPAYSLPGESQVSVVVQTTTIRSLTGTLIGQPVTTQFRTAQGSGIVNAPVCPEAVYIGIGGAEPGVSVLDLNGFGQGTGDPDPAVTRFPLNPNVGIPGVFPPLSPGTTTLDGGSRGALSLTRDTNLNTRLLRDPIVGEVADIHIGGPLDLVFNNENINVNVTRANQINPVTIGRVTGNTISQPPHPNPPRLVFPPPNPNRAIFGEEPTMTTTQVNQVGLMTTLNPPCVNSPVNQLTRGNPFSNQQGAAGIYGNLYEGIFYGPQPPPLSPPPPPPYCRFTARQQVGHFLYVLDRSNRQIVIVNSNRFTILDTIRLSDPVSMTMSPNMTRLAVTNFASSTVSFIDIDPTSPAFHRVVAETRVERGPSGIAWQPDGEDVLVLSTGANLLSIIGAGDFAVRRTVSGFLNQPIEVAVTPRFVASGFAQGVYYAYVLNGNGSVAVYESGPDGVNGYGFNNFIGLAGNATFPRARTINYDYTNSNGAVLVGHVDDTGLGQVSRLELTSSPVGTQPLSPNATGFILPPTFRQKQWSVTQRFGGNNATTPQRDFLSGNSIIDVAQDEMVNVGGAPGQQTQFNSLFAITPYNHSGKHAIKIVANAPTLPTIPKLMFIALSDVGRVDVLEIATGRKIASIPVPGVRCVSSYWRQ